MTAVGIVLAGASGALVALGLALAGSPPYVSASASLMGLAWVAVLAFRPKTPVHGLLLFLGLVGASAAAVEGQTLLGLAACTTSLFAWDSATMQRLFARLPPRGRRSARARYAIHALVAAAAALGVPAIAFVIHPRVGFPLALGLSLAAIAALGVALWQTGRVFRMPTEPEDDDTPQEANPSRGKEEGAGDS